jgi:hypothetical protein
MATVITDKDRLPSMIYLGKQEPNCYCYLVEYRKNSSLEDLYLLNGIYIDCLDWIKEKFGYPCPECEQILLWEVFPQGHRKLIWHFSGWKYDIVNMPEQGSYNNEFESVYSISLGKTEEDYGDFI